MEIGTDFCTELFSIKDQKPGHELFSYAVHVQIRHYDCLHFTDGSNVLNGSPTILMHKSQNWLHIFRGWIRKGRPDQVIFCRSWSVHVTQNTLHDLSFHCQIMSNISVTDLQSLIKNLMKLQMTQHTMFTEWRKEGNVLFNDALNTFYLRLYGVIHMVKNNSDSEAGNPLLLHGLLFPISSKGSFICIIPQTG